MTVLIAGAGIAGLATALTCHQLGIPVKLFESSASIKPLGVGINLQPNAVRELIELGLGDRLDTVGVPTRSFRLHSKHGHLIWEEPRGIKAGYKWPQYSVHRGHLQMMLYEETLSRLGAQAIVTGHRVRGYRNTKDGVEIDLEGTGRGVQTVSGDLLIAADGIHSAIRAQMYPQEGDPIWAGTILWRSTTRMKPFCDVPTMVMIGHETQRIVAYPISPTDHDTGLATINWIAEKTIDPSLGYEKENYSRQVDIGKFTPLFKAWQYDWFDTHTMMHQAETVFEYPMVDRDPLDQWTDGNTTLIGDAAHVMYPTGSNGASQAIIDARKLGRAFLDHGIGPEALQAYEAEMRPATAKVVLANRSKGPDALLQVIEDRCGGQFDDINDIMPQREMDELQAGYKQTAGFAIETLNRQPAIIPAGATLS